jgi:acetolactate synthase-1/3 small subunit
VTSGDDECLEQIEKQLAKLVDIRDIKELKPEESVYRELVLIKVKATAEQRQSIIAIADIFRSKIIDVAAESLIIELTGNQSKIDAFIGLLDGYEILELARTGIAGLGRGIENVTML